MHLTAQPVRGSASFSNHVYSHLVHYALNQLRVSCGIHNGTTQYEPAKVSCFTSIDKFACACSWYILQNLKEARLTINE